MATDAAVLEPSLRDDLERVLRRLATAGKIPDRGERELIIRVTPDGHIRWFQPTAVRVPVSELEHAAV